MGYVEVAMGDVRFRGRVFNTSALPTLIKQAQSTNQVLYFSYYEFEEDIIHHFQKYKSIRSYKGKCYLKRILFDIDKGSNTAELTLERTKVFIDKLVDDWKIDEDNLKIWFSGSGYHIVIPDIFGFEPSETLPNIVKATLTEYFPEADDIYDGARLIRVGNTINQKTNLYKTGFTYEEFRHLKVEDVLLAAKTPRKTEFGQGEDQTGIYRSKIIYPSHAAQPAQVDEFTSVVTCMQKLYTEPASLGSRHVKIIRMVSAYRRAGIPLDGIIALMKNWAVGMEEAEIEQTVKYIYQKAYRFGCNDEVMQKYCDSRCIYYKTKNYTPEILSAADMEKQYHEFIHSDIRSQAINLANIWHGMDDFWIYPQEFVLLIGDTGINKSAWMQNLVLKANMSALYIDNEVGSRLMYRRFIQIQNDMNKTEVDDYYQKNHNSLSSTIDYIHYVSKRLNLDDLKKIINEISPQIIVLDTVGRLNTSSTKSPLVEIAETVKSIAMERNLIVMGVHHVSKGALMDYRGNPKKLGVHSGKGDSDMEQMADKVISIEGSQTAPFREISSLKARDEMPFKAMFRVNMDTFRFYKLKD
jgi:hypothetical protein